MARAARDWICITHGSPLLRLRIAVNVRACPTKDPFRDRIKSQQENVDHNFFEIERLTDFSFVFYEIRYLIDSMGDTRKSFVFYDLAEI